MSHYRATFIHGFIRNMDELEGMVIECDAASEQAAAEILFSVANRGNEIPSEVQVIEPLKGTSMTVGDLAIIVDLSNRSQAALWCDLYGWSSDNQAPEVPLSLYQKMREMKVS